MDGCGASSVGGNGKRFVCGWMVRFASLYFRILTTIVKEGATNIKVHLQVQMHKSQYKRGKNENTKKDEEKVTTRFRSVYGTDWNAIILVFSERGKENFLRQQTNKKREKKETMSSSSSSANQNPKPDIEAGEATGLLNKDGNSPDRTNGSQETNDSDRLWDELDRPWPATFERSISLLASPVIDAADAEHYTKSPKPGNTPLGRRRRMVSVFNFVIVLLDIFFVYQNSN